MACIHISQKLNMKDARAHDADIKTANWWKFRDVCIDKGISETSNAKWSAQGINSTFRRDMCQNLVTHSLAPPPWYCKMSNACWATKVVWAERADVVSVHVKPRSALLGAKSTVHTPAGVWIIIFFKKKRSVEKIVVNR